MRKHSKYSAKKSVNGAKKTSSIFCWIFSIVLIVSFLGNISGGTENSQTGGVFALALALIFFPPVYSLLNKFGKPVSFGKRILMLVFTVIIVGMFSGGTLAKAQIGLLLCIATDAAIILLKRKTIKQMEAQIGLWLCRATDAAIILFKRKTIKQVDMENRPISMGVNIGESAEYTLNDTATGTYSAVQIKRPAKKLEMPYTLFEKMRRISGTQGYGEGNSFYAQAKFMEHFEDEYGGNAMFMSYYPTYSHMDDEQLRTYFTWRTKVRAGTVLETSPSYVFVYIYELINNIGVQNVDDAVRRLVFIWERCDGYARNLDSYLKRWIKDYYICNGFNISFQEFAKKYGIQQYYPEAFVQSEKMSFAFYDNISSYKITHSKFYAEEKDEIIEKCFDSVIEKVKLYFAKYSIDLEKVLFGQVPTATYWYPYSGAVHFDVKPSANKKIIISDNEWYEYRNGNWACVAPDSYNYEAATIIGYIIKRMEARMREITKFKYKLSPNITALKSSLSQLGRNRKISFKYLNEKFDAAIDNAVIEYFEVNHGKVLKNPDVIFRKPIDIHIDEAALDKIRQDASDIQERLIVNDAAADNIVQETEQVAVEVPEMLDSPKSMVPFDDVQIRFIRILIAAENIEKEISEFVQNSGILPQVMMEQINEIAFETFRDNIIEISAIPPFIYEDYLDEVASLIGGVK